MRAAPLLFLLWACTTTRHISQPLTARDLRELNEAMRNREVDLSYLPETSSVYEGIEGAVQVHLAPDRVRFVEDGKPRELPPLALHSLFYLSPGSPRLRGALEGAAVGAGPAVAGVAIALIIKFNCKGSCTTEEGIPAIIGLGLGAVAPIVGALIGHHDEVFLRSIR